MQSCDLRNMPSCIYVIKEYVVFMWLDTYFLKDLCDLKKDVLMVKENYSRILVVEGTCNEGFMWLKEPADSGGYMNLYSRETIAFHSSSSSLIPLEL